MATDPLVYTTGTVSCVNGSATVTGTATGWAAALVASGLFSAAGRSIPILEVVSDTELTLAYPWTGPNYSGVYAIARGTSESVRATWINDRLAQILAKLAIAGVTPRGAGTEADRDALDPQPEYDPDNPYIWLRLEPNEDLAFSMMTGSGWSNWYPLPAGADGASFSGGLGDLTDVTLASLLRGDVLRYDGDSWVNDDPSGWKSVTVVANTAVIDIDAGDKFLVTVDDDCEIVLDNAVEGAPFAIRIQIDGTSHSVTFGAEFLGEAPEILTGDGDETVVSGIVLDAGSGTTAIVNLVKQIPASS